MDTFAFVPKPPLQAYVAPPVACTLMVGKVQFRTVLPLEFVIPATGVAAFCVMLMDCVAVHPFVPVTVTV